MHPYLKGGNNSLAANFCGGSNFDLNVCKICRKTFFTEFNAFSSKTLKSCAEVITFFVFFSVDPGAVFLSLLYFKTDKETRSYQIQLKFEIKLF